MHLSGFFTCILLSAIPTCHATSIRSHPFDNNPTGYVTARRASAMKDKRFGAIKSLEQIQADTGGKVQVDAPGQPQTKIIGGNDADYGEYEYYVQLFYGTSGLLCGGSLIAPDVVLTAAHCFVEELQYVSIGSYELATTYGVENGYAEHSEIVDITIHPSFDPDNSLEFDIMLLKLADPFPEFQPLALNFDEALPAVGDSVMVIGLGLTNTEDSESVADVLQEIVLETIPTDECFPPGSILNNLLNDATEFCASTPGKAGGKDSCQGDSGGPIFAINDTGEHVQMGVVSWGGNPCAAPGEGGVYSRVSASKDFIVQAVCDDFGSEAAFCDQNIDADSNSGESESSSESDNDTDSHSGSAGDGSEQNNGNTGGLGSCSATETYLLFEIKVDSYGSEVSWDLTDAQGAVMYSDNNFLDGETRSYGGCLSQTESDCYYITIYDSYADGMGYPHNGESAYVAVLYGQSSYLDNPAYACQLVIELCN